MTLSFPYRQNLSNSTTLPLDTILTALQHDLHIRSREPRSTLRFELCRYLVIRLFDASRGNLINAQIRLAQVTLSKKLKISLRWVHELAHRLAELGWLEFSSEKLPDGTNGSTVWRLGPMAKRVLVALSKSKQRKIPIKTPTHSRWNFSPLRREKEILRLLAKEKEPPSEAMLTKIPLLRRWLDRGKTGKKGGDKK
jgi:hypothetical protein